MIARQKIRYPFLGPDAREYAPGETFTIREDDDLTEQRHAEALQAYDKATLAPKDDSEVAPKKRYNRRDLRAEE